MKEKLKEKWKKKLLWHNNCVILSRLFKNINRSNFVSISIIEYFVIFHFAPMIDTREIRSPAAKRQSLAHTHTRTQITFLYLQHLLSISRLNEKVSLNLAAIIFIYYKHIDAHWYMEQRIKFSSRQLHFMFICSERNLIKNVHFS